MSKWGVVYKKAIQDDGSLLFPERLSTDFLSQQKKVLGSYMFANQYQNEIIPEGLQTFQKSWFRYYRELPAKVNTFAFIDPAISEADTADFTGTVVISADCEQNWYVRHASRQKINPSQVIDFAFNLHDQYKCAIIGFEDVVFQRAIIHFAHEEMKRRNKRIPLMGIKRGNDKTKETRILSLVPRFEWGSLFLSQGLHDLELELATFPRGAHDDILDALASLESIVHYPQKTRPSNEQPNPGDPGYESWYIKNLHKRAGANEE